jgi:hypothetical protein
MEAAMKRTVCLTALAVAATAWVVVSPAVAQPPDFLRDYRFVTPKSVVHVTGGSQNYDMNLNILGQFGLVTGYGYEPSPVAQTPTLTPHAEFVDVRGILFNPLSANPVSAAPTPLPGWDLDKTLNLSGLTGTFTVPSDIHFTGDDGQGIPINLDATLRGPLLHLTGQNVLPPTCATCTQYVGYKVDAIAVIRPYADFNLDGVIDDADLAIWRANLGTTSDATFQQGDANGDGVVDAADYVIWRHSEGPATSLSVFANSGLSSGTVPEPTGLLLTLTAACGFGSIWRLRSTHSQ